MLSISGSWITAEAGFEWTETHFLLGYFSLGLVVFRIIWGFVGPHHARFNNFVAGPKRAGASLPQLFNRQPATSVGHNPIGGWSVIAFLILVAIQASTGLFISDDIFYQGPYNAIVSSDMAGTLARVHHVNFTVLQTFIAAHILVIAWYAFGKHSNLVRPMISGKKRLEEPQLAYAIQSSQLAKACIIAALVTLLVTLVVQLAPPPVVDDYF